MRPFSWPRLVGLVLILSVLSACSSLGLTKDKQPLSANTVKALATLGATPTSPMLVRVFKESSELEGIGRAHV